MTDVCLILEGTYPYVVGGVSTWIHNLISELRDISFSILFVSTTGDIVRQAQYELPPNIEQFEEVFIRDFIVKKEKTFGAKKEAWEKLGKFYNELADDNIDGFEEMYRLLFSPTQRRLNTHDLIFSKQSWNFLTKIYQEKCPDVSFIDFYWATRFMHLPLFQLFEAQIPPARVYHTACTGYAGLLGVLAKMKYGAPLMLTEHGIYTHERKMEIARAKWIYTPEQEVLRPQRSLGFFKELWIKKFELISKLTYKYADQIITLSKDNRKIQILSGAPSEKSIVIPNGIKLDLLNKSMTVKHIEDGVPTVALVGRVVPIKDIKTFIRACKVVSEKMPEARFYVIGPTDEDEKYYQECQKLTELLGLKDFLAFTGHVDMEEYYPKIDLMVLTSVSEAQPLSVLESMALGIPIVASDVGACREMITGSGKEDKSIGNAGIVTKVGSPSDTAQAIIDLLQNDSLRAKASKVGKDRMKKYYHFEELIDQYRDLYTRFMMSAKQKEATRWPA
jgi:glycosyltransferase involved in cell wall biosynthesis